MTLAMTPTGPAPTSTPPPTHDDDDPHISPRYWSVEQRRAAFLAAKKKDQAIFLVEGSR